MAKASEPGHGREVRVCPRCRAVYVSERASCGLDGAPLVERPSDPLVGGAIDRYQVIELLGEGAAGRVYAARHAVLEREYAIKVLYGDHAAEPKFRERFRREAQSISRIRHPNIVTVEDFGETPEGLMFLVLERVYGEALDRLLDREAPLAPARARALGRQLAAGLGAAHELGFVHRDVKPSNVMVMGSPDDGEQVKILDFGTVSFLSVPRDQRLTHLGHLIGTPTYMAPEQSQDPGVTPAADVYGLGVVMYEMLTSHPPFWGENRTEVLLQHATSTPPPLPPCEGLEHVVQRLLDKDPDRRPTARALEAELATPAPPDTEDQVPSVTTPGDLTSALETPETQAALAAAAERTLDEQAELLMEPTIDGDPDATEVADATQVDVPAERPDEEPGTEIVRTLAKPLRRPDTPSEGPYVDELPTVAATSSPFPVMPVPLTQEDADVSSAGAGFPGGPLSRVSVEPGPPVLRSGEPASTADLDPRTPLERWLLPLTVGLLVAATLALVGALAHRGLAL